MNSDIFAASFKPTPFWWEGHEEADAGSGALPAKADVVVVGSGYTGLSAALTLARAGRDVVVLDAERPGHGCSTRNGGHIGPGINFPLSEMIRVHGEETGLAIKREGNDAFAFLLNFITAEGIDCELSLPGHFVGAHTSKAFDRLRARIESEPREFCDARLVEQRDVRQEIGTDAFYGGAVFAGRGGLNPKMFHKGLMARAVGAGARVYGFQPVLDIGGKPGSLTIRTAKGQIWAKNIVLATNGYTSPATPWWNRRIISIGSYLIATEELPSELVMRLCPKGYQMNETRKVIYYYRPSPDGRRILFGGRVAMLETDTRVSAPRLHSAMTRIFPELRETKITHSWMGFPAFTFDSVPHMGVHDGVHFAMGYCGNGVPTSTYLGDKVANLVLDRPQGHSVFASLDLQGRVYFNGKPWFLAPAIMYYKLKDRFLS